MLVDNSEAERVIQVLLSNDTIVQSIQELSKNMKDQHKGQTKLRKYF